MPGDCREGVGAEESEDVEVRARFLKVCEGGDGVSKEDTVGGVPAGWIIEAVDGSPLSKWSYVCRSQ